jgi:hypothetical protein
MYTDCDFEQEIKVIKFKMLQRLNHD